MSIIRVAHNRDNPYVIVNKKSLWDENLSLEAVGLLARLLSRPDNWQINATELAKSCQSGKDRIYRILNELIKFGYVYRHQERTGKQGLFDKIVYYVFEVPMPEEEIKKMFTQRENPDTVSSCVEKPAINKKESLILNLSSLKSSPSKYAVVMPRKTRPAAAPPIILNPEKRDFDGISLDDLNAWRKTFTAINLDTEIKRCVEWAMTTPRKNYRKSLLAWFSNAEKNHKKGYPQQKQEEYCEITSTDLEINKKKAQEWEQKWRALPQSKNQTHYGIQSLSQNLLFTLPGGGFEVSYLLRHEDFLKKCVPSLKKIGFR